MKTRILSAVIALPIVIVPIYLGGLATYILLAVAILIGLYEFNNAFGIKSPILYTIQILCTFALFYIQWNGLNEYFFFGSVMMIILSFLYYTLRYPRYSLEKIFVSIIGFNYISVMMAHILMVREMENVGHVLVWLILIIAMGSDTCAYFVGVFFGKNKLAPELSPKKTIEGAIGGLVGSAILTIAFTVFLRQLGIEFELKHYIGFGLLGIIGSVFSMFGDLAASAMKRVTKIKDFGHLIPGHGGIVDRMDSIIFVAPIVYYATLIIFSI